MERTKAYRVGGIGTLLVCFGLALSARAAPPEGARPARLDLRLPAAVEIALPRAAANTLSRRGMLPEQHGTDDHNSLSALDEVAQVRSVSRAQELAQRFRHEGLPVARLWENHTALVSLGLNSRGKPGLWLVQKTR